MLNTSITLRKSYILGTYVNLNFISNEQISNKKLALSKYF